MSAAQLVIQNYGESITVGGSTGRGFIACLDPDSAASHKKHLAPGVANRSKYRLITDMRSVSEGAAVVCGGREYRVLRVETVSIFGAFSHNECVLCLKGGAVNAP